MFQHKFSSKAREHSHRRNKKSMAFDRQASHGARCSGSYVPAQVRQQSPRTQPQKKQKKPGFRPPSFSRSTLFRESPPHTAVALKKATRVRTSNTMPSSNTTSNNSSNASSSSSSNGGSINSSSSNSGSSTSMLLHHHYYYYYYYYYFYYYYYYYY